MGTRRRRGRQEESWYRGALAEAPGHPFYTKLSEVFEKASFDQFGEGRCRKFYHERLGRPSFGAGDVFPCDADRFFRGDRERARYRVAGG